MRTPRYATSQVILYPGVDHDMLPSTTGCMKERNNRRSWRAGQEYLDIMNRWLAEQE